MPVLSLGLDISKLKSGSSQAVNQLDAINKSVQGVQRSVDDLGGSFASAAKQVLALVGAYQALEGMKGFVQRGVEFNSSIEQSRIGMGSLITAMVTLQDEQGRVLEGQEKYAAAQGMAADLMKEIQRLGLETTATTQELVQGVQNVMGSALQAGLKLEQIPRFAVAGAQAMQTLGIPLEQMRTELDALLTGRIDGGDDILAPRLGLDKATIQAWREQGVLFDRLMEKFAAFEMAGKDVAQTWKGLTSNLSEAMDVFAGEAASNMSESLKDAVRTMQNLILETGNGAPRISEDFEHIAAIITDVEDALGAGILNAVESFASAVRDANAAIGEMGGTEAFWGRLQTSIATVGAALASITVLRRSGALEAVKASQQETEAMVTEQKATLTLAQTERDAAQAARDLAAQQNASAQAAIQEARSQIQIAQAQAEAARGREQNAYASARLQQALAAESVARQSLNQAQREARATAAALTAAETTLATAETRLAAVTQATATATSLQARSLSTAQGVWTAACSAMTAAAGRLGNGLKALWAGLGGGVGVAITALTTGLTYLATRQDDAAKAADLHTQAQKNFEEALKSSTDEAGKQTTALTELQKQRLATARTEAEQAYRLQLKQATDAINELIAKQENLRSTWQEVGSDASFIVPADFTDTLQEMVGLLQRGDMSVKEFQEQLANLRNEAVNAGYGNSEFVKSLDEINSQEGAVDVLATIAKTLEEISGRAPDAGNKMVQAVNKTVQSIKGLDEALKKSEFAKFSAGLGSGDRAAAAAMQGFGFSPERIGNALKGNFEGMSAKDAASLQQLISNYRAANTTRTSSRSSGGGSSSIDSAQRSIAALRREIAEMNGEASRTENTVAKKFEDIAKAGKDAGMSSEQISQLQGEYQKAFQSKTLEDFNKELLQVQGNTAALRQLEISDKMKEWKASFEAAGMTADQYGPKLAALQEALAKQQNFKDLQTASQFYKELADLSGDYGLSLETQNRLIREQADLYIHSGISEELVKQWETLKKIETARDPFSGIARSTSQYFANATNYAQQMGSIWESTMDDMADALTNFVMSGKLDFQDLANSFIEQVIRMQMQAMVSGLFKGIGGIVTGIFGGGNTYADESESLLRGMFAKGGVLVGGGISALSGGVYNKPTFFSYGVQKFAKGGVLGEAGPEAVMPLARMSNGKLGVQSAGVGGVVVPVNIQVINEAGNNVGVETQQRQNDQGGVDIMLMIKRMIVQDITQGNGGMIAKGLEGTYQNLQRYQRGR